MLKENSFYTTEPWMSGALKLKGSKLSVFAIVYSFYRADSVYIGSLRYLMEWTGRSKPCVHSALKSLVASGYLIRGFSAGRLAYTVNKSVIDELIKKYRSEQQLLEAQRNSFLAEQ